MIDYYYYNNNNNINKIHCFIHTYLTYSLKHETIKYLPRKCQSAAKLEVGHFDSTGQSQILWCISFITSIFFIPVRCPLEQTPIFLKKLTAQYIDIKTISQVC